MRVSLLNAVRAAPAYLLAAAAPAHAQEAQAQAAASAADDIIVTGTRARDRTVLDSPVPVDVLTAREIVQAGASGEVAQALQQLTPSFNFPRQSNSGAGDAVRAAQLRGLSPDQLLVLVNGKRYHTTATPNLETKVGRGTAPVDFNTIPLNAIGRVEVLRDGAGAQYGSDAIAGVINVRLDRIEEGGSVGVTYGLNVTRPGVLDETLTDGQTAFVDAKFGTRLGADGFLTVGGDYLFQQGTNRAGRDQGGQFLTGGSYTDPRNAPFFGQRLFKVGDPRVEGGHLWYNAEAPAGELTLYSFGIGHYREALGSNFFRWPVRAAGGGVNYVAPNQPNSLNGFRPVGVIRSTDLSLTAGARGEAAGWRLDGSVTYGFNRVTQRLRESLNYSLGGASPNTFLVAGYRSDQLTTNLDASRTFDAGLAGPVTVAAGAEYRRETWRSRPGDEASYAVGPLAGPPLFLPAGAQGAPGLTPADARRLSRDVVAGYLEVSAEPAPSLFLDAAARVEHYSDAGTSVAGKGSARLEVAPGFALRGSVSNSFRAPALAQRGVSATVLSFGSGGALRQVGTLPVDSPAARALGARALDPEKSFNLSAGITAAPLAGLRLSVDAFRILTDNRITLSERFDLSGLSAGQRAALGLGTFDAINFFTNAVDLRTQGIEAVATYTASLAQGSLTLNAAYSYAENEIRRVRAAPPEIAANGLSGSLIGLEERNTLETAVPRTKFIASAAWAGDRLNGLVRATRFGAVTRQFDFGGGFAPSQRFAGEWSVDAEVGVNVTPALSFAVGGQNLFDAYPAPSSDDINGAGNLAYDVLSPIGINGRYLYARARLSF